MGNRATVSFNESPNSPALYFHWNGGRASIVGFLSACHDLGCKSIDDIEFALRPFFGNMSLYLETVKTADKDNWDNGWYLIDKNLEIRGRKFHRNGEERNPEKTQAIKEYVLAANLGHCRYSFARETS